MHTLVSQLNKFYQWAGLTINNLKCTVIAHDWVTNKPLATSHFLIKGKPLPRLQPHQTYKYLGVEVAINGSWAQEKARVRAELTQ